jgi:UDP-glucose 4-epimerase
LTKAVRPHGENSLDKKPVSVKIPPLKPPSVSFGRYDKVKLIKSGVKIQALKIVRACLGLVIYLNKIQPVNFMKILVTGGAGFIGSHLVDALVEDAEEVLIVDDLSSGKKEFINPKAKFFEGDIRSADTQSAIKEFKPEAVFHLAAQKSVRESIRKPAYDAEINIIGLLKLLETCVDLGVQKFIFASTGGAMYGDNANLPASETEPENPESPYGLAKFASEKYLQLFSRLKKSKTMILRLANVYGPRQDPFGEAGVVAIFCQRAVAGETLFVNGDGKQTRDYLFVADAVKAFLKALSLDASGVFNIGTGKELSVLDIIMNLKTQHAPDLVYEHREPMAGEMLRSVLNCEKARQELMWTARVDFAEGLTKTFQYFKNNQNL